MGCRLRRQKRWPSATPLSGLSYRRSGENDYGCGGDAPDLMVEGAAQGLLFAETPGDTTRSNRLMDALGRIVRRTVERFSGKPE